MISRDKKIRWGILGCGSIAEKFASDLLLSDNAVLSACASRSFENSKRFAKKFQATYFFDSYEELANCPIVDVIYVATPNSFHLEHSKLCLKNKKAVVKRIFERGNDEEIKSIVDFYGRKNIAHLLKDITSSFIPQFEVNKLRFLNNEI